jgi:hypothetical protein
MLYLMCVLLAEKDGQQAVIDLIEAARSAADPLGAITHEAVSSVTPDTDEFVAAIVGSVMPVAIEYPHLTTFHGQGVLDVAQTDADEDLQFEVRA